MLNERRGSLVDSYYHNWYGLLQRHNFLGAWERCLQQHGRALQNLNPNPSVLYCGTATDKNPQDVLTHLKSKQISANLTVIDLSGEPLKSLDSDTFKPTRASALTLPFPNKSFDYITTDFLFSKMDLPSIIATVQEWGRVLKDGGLITTTATLHNDRSIENSIYNVTTPILGAHFVSEDILNLIFTSAGLNARFQVAEFDKKPYLYQYPDRLMAFIEARPIEPNHHKEVELAQTILKDAISIYDATNSKKNLMPLELEEIIHDISSGNFITKKAGDGEIIGFIRIHQLTDQWVEVGSLYVDPNYRKNDEHYGSKLLEKALDYVQSHKKSSISFTNNQTAMAMCNKNLGRKVRILPLAIIIPLIKERSRNVSTINHVISTLLHEGGVKTSYIFTY